MVWGAALTLYRQSKFLKNTLAEVLLQALLNVFFRYFVRRMTTQKSCDYIATRLSNNATDNNDVLSLERSASHGVISKHCKFILVV